MFGVVAALVAGVAVGGIGLGVLAATLSVLVFGPAYLVQNRIRRRRGTLPPPPAKSTAERATADAQFLRIAAVMQFVIAVVALPLALVGRGSFLPGSGWTALLLLVAAFGMTETPYVWAIAEWRERQRSLRGAWVLKAAFDLLFGVAAAVGAGLNQHGHWIGGTAWTVVLGVLAVIWLLGAPGDIARARD